MWSFALLEDVKRLKYTVTVSTYEKVHTIKTRIKPGFKRSNIVVQHLLVQQC